MKIIYKLGREEECIIPSPEAIKKLKEILTGVDGKVTDIVWGPDLKFDLVPENIEEVEKLTEYYKAKNAQL